MPGFEEALHRANELLEEFKKLPAGEAGRAHVYERALAACADAVEALEADGRANAALVKVKEEVRKTGQSSLRAEEVIRRLRQARQL
jgi:hypothetical protein